jgi:hypothetical protein
MMTSRPSRRARLLATASATVCGKAGSQDALLAGANRVLVENGEAGGRYTGATVLRSRSGPSGMTLPRALPKEASR